VDLIVPEEAFEAVHAAVVKNRQAPEFKRVVMSLQDVLSGDFFTEYIKKGTCSMIQVLVVACLTLPGNVMMLSQGRIGIDNVYCLKDGTLFPVLYPHYLMLISILGVLTMFLDKEAYERAGLVGKPHGVKGKRGLKPRWGKSLELWAG
jgi:ribonuclease P/MRP protein subunit RPP40